MKIWVDVEDLFTYARFHSRPSGIQRLTFEIYVVLQARLGTAGLGFVRHHKAGGTFRAVSWDQVTALFDEMVCQPDSFSRSRRPGTGRATSQHPFIALQSQALIALQDMVRAGLWSLHAQRTTRRATRPAEAAPAGSFDTLVAPGDVLLMLGATWIEPGYCDRISRARRRHRLRTALLIYDLIPLLRPEWCSKEQVSLFTTWLRRMTTESDVLFAISRACANDLDAFVAAEGIARPSPIRPIPIGSGFGSSAPRQDDLHEVGANEDGANEDGAHEDGANMDFSALPPPGSYVLLISTIEIRKNHALMVRVWQRMLEEMPRDDVPTLVFAGRPATLVADLLHRIANDHRLDGKLRMISEPSDAALGRLYRGCLFTVFPSFFEGWGLPVTESLALGKPCICSNATSLPEAGGQFARYFDPDSLADAHAVIRATIEDRADLAAWTARIVRDFVPVAWSETVDAMLAGIAVQGAADAGA